MGINEDVARLLETPAVQRINLACGPTRVWGGGYGIIASAIRRSVAEGHRVVVESNTILEAIGCGNYNENMGPNRVNKMMLPFSTMRDTRDRAVAVHEATHALQDYTAAPMLQSDSECAAYIAQMMYAHLDGGRFPFEVSGTLNPDVLELFNRAYAVAVRILTTSGGYTVTMQEQRDIKSTLQRLGPYRNASSRMILYNGI